MLTKRSRERRYHVTDGPMRLVASVAELNTFGMKCFLAAVLILGMAADCRLTPPATASAQITGWASAGRDQFTLSEIQDVPP